MWGLDRITAQSTSAYPPPRPYSPAPRRPGLPSRPHIQSRDSSLSLHSNSSSTNVSTTYRTSVGSSLKNQINATPPPEVEDPLHSLERLLGPLRTNGGNPSDASKPVKLVFDIDFGGKSLQDLATTEIEASRDQSYTLTQTGQTVVEYNKDKSQYEDLQHTIRACDDALRSVEKYLSRFQADLSIISSEIETLQSKSSARNTRLENRSNAEKLLGPITDRITLPPAVVKKIAEGHVDESWTKALLTLQAYERDFESGNLPENVKAVEDLRPIIGDLKGRAVERIREYFAGQIRALRAPNVNAQIIQQQKFLPYASLFAFLAIEQPVLAEDISKAYSHTMRWYYHTYFSRYHASLSRIKLYANGQNGGMGDDLSGTLRNKAAVSGPTYDLFNLGRRVDVIRNPTNAAMPSHAAEEAKAAHFMETPFLAYNLALVDNASFEYLFCTSFFTPSQVSDPSTPITPIAKPSAKPPPISPSILAALLNAMLSPLTSLGLSLTRTLISETHDALGILLLIRLTQHFAFTLQRRKVPTLDTYINGTTMLLWPRFQQILDMHCDSLRKLTSAVPARGSSGGAAASALGVGGGASSNSNGPSTAPHPVTQRFANFALSILSLSSEAADDEPLANSLGRLRSEFEGFLGKMAAAFGASERGKREGNRFLANNYTLVLAVLGDVKGKLAEEVQGRFEELKAELEG